ncbi:MAG: YfhO family protein [Clostridiales bacterium]|nr:YfhO family protein [Clostridiales bacterium]
MDGICYIGEISKEQMTVGKPLLYGSVLAILFVGYYLINMQGRIRQKIAYVLLLIALMRSFKYYNLNCMWHGMQPPMGSPYRFAFIYVFLIIEMAHAGFL